MTASLTVSYAHGRMSVPLNLTSKQRELMDRAIANGSIEVEGQTMTAEQLSYCFRGESIPRDPRVRKALDMEIFAVR